MSDFLIEVKQEVLNQNGVSYEKTVLVKSFERGKPLKTSTYGWISREKVYAMIAAGNPVTLRNAYLEDFSLDEYRKLHGMDVSDAVEIRGWETDDCFFDSRKDTVFSYGRFIGDVKCRHSVFSKGNVTFYKSAFSGGADFSFSDFGSGNVSFQFSEFGKGTVNFQGARFGGEEVSFVNTKFGDGDANFGEIDFGAADVFFHFARFGKGEVSFEKSTFRGRNIDFRTVEFGEGRANFRRVEFGDGEVLFKEAEFGGKVNFKSSRFGSGGVSFELTDFGKGGEAIFERAAFGGQITFSQSRSGLLSLKETQLDNYVDLRVSEAGIIDLSDTVVRDMIDFIPVGHEVKIGTLNINGMRNLGRIFIDWKRNNVYRLIASQEDTNFMEKANQFNILKEDFNSTGKYIFEDYAYVAFKRFELKAELDDARKAGGRALVLKYPEYYFKLLVFDKMGLYATNPVRVLVSMVIVYLFFSFVYISLDALGIHSDVVSSLGDPDKLGVIKKSFYHSAVTILTIGYGDYYPSGHARWISAAEGWMGLFMMSYFTVAFVRKILR